MIGYLVANIFWV